MFQEFCRLLDIDKIRTTAYKPSTNGNVERFHRTLNSMLAKVVAHNQRDWDLHLPAVLAAYRSSRHESTGFSPNFMLFGRENRAPLDLVLPDSPDGPCRGPSQYVDDIRKRITCAHAEARESLGRAAETRKQYYDRFVHARTFKVGDWVWKYYPRRYRRRSPKWCKWYVGPFLVIREIAPCNFVVQRSARAEPEVVHVDKLKPCLGVTPRSWLSEAVAPVVSDTQCPELDKVLGSLAGPSGDELADEEELARGNGESASVGPHSDAGDGAREETTLYPPGSPLKIVVGNPLASSETPVRRNPARNRRHPRRFEQ